MHIPTFVFIFILFLKNILLLLLYPKHVIKLLGYNLGCYRNELKNASCCPTYGASRWEVNSSGAKKRKGVPTKVMCYFPPIPRFKRMFHSSKTAKDLTWHAQEREFDGKMCQPSDSPSWKLIDHRWTDGA